MKKRNLLAEKVHQLAQALKEYHKMKIQMNRIQYQILGITHKMEKAANAQRQSRTRTLIQLGGLLSLSGLPNLLGIVEGEDLQADIHAREKAAILLGMLTQFMETAEFESDHYQWLNKGLHLLKQKV